MKSINVTVILLAVFILTVSPYLQAGNWLGFAVSLSDDDQEMPDIDGSLIVFQQLVEGDWDIYAAEISDPQNPLVLAVAAFTNDQTAPAVSGSIVVWQDFVDTDFGIYGTDINDSDNVFTIADYEQDQADQVAPAIQGNTVVWADNYYGDWDIYAADISNTSAPVVFSVTPFTGDQTSADVFGTNVVWQDVGTSPEDTILYLTDISNTASLVHNIIADFPGEQSSAAISGNQVVWDDSYSGTWGAYVADITLADRPAESAITNPLSQAQNVDIDGHIIVYQDDRNGNWDIFAYNTSTGQEYVVVDHPADQTNPAVSGNIVVWQDSRDDALNIYAAILDGPLMALCTEKPAGDINSDCMVDMTDMALFAQSWLQCNLQPEGACWQ